MYNELRFEFMENDSFEEYAEILFSILHGNMSEIIPPENSYEYEYTEWHSAVGSGIKHPARRIVLIRTDNKIAGFFQYYTNTETFMMEEIQLLKDYRHAGIFRALYDFIIPFLPETVRTVKAFAHKANTVSDGILRHIGLLPTGEENIFTAYSGTIEDFLAWHKKEK